MIQGLDCVVLSAAAPTTSVAEYEALLGRRADRRTAEGASETSFVLANVCLEITGAQTGAAPSLSGLVFAVSDIGKARHLLARRALPATPDDAGRLRIAAEATHGVSLFLVERTHADNPRVHASAAADMVDSAVTGLDHVVVRTPDPERAVALYAGRLGLSLRLDRSEPAWGVRLLFFRCGDLIVEVAHDLKAGKGDGPDRLWGLSWRVGDLAKAHARMQAAGIAVSEMRDGRRPGTRVFTAKSHTAGVPTLVIGPGPQRGDGSP
jgi:catechol 2,3-dioxygenase-like lactoylglutathione lyase family enzyme